VIYELLALSEVLKAVQSTGTQVVYHDAKCQTHKVAGLYRIGPNVDRLVICPSNQHNHSDLFDTIRHEAIHVVQACKGGAILPYDYYIKNATDDAKEAVANYPQDRHTQHYELEAHMAADGLNEKEVISLINKYCFE
jgi:hypothetical protein